MKIILLMAMTINGYIAKENNETPWSSAEWDAYATFVKKHKNIVVGRRTYEIMKEAGEFEKIGSPAVVVVSRQTQVLGKNDDRTIFVSSPQEAITVLQERGIENIIVSGGSSLCASFLNEGLIDEIYLDIEPLLFGKGVALFARVEKETRLRLWEITKLSENTMRCHYKIAKS